MQVLVLPLHRVTNYEMERWLDLPNAPSKIQTNAISNIDICKLFTFFNAINSLLVAFESVFNIVEISKLPT